VRRGHVDAHGVARLVGQERAAQHALATPHLERGRVVDPVVLQRALVPHIDKHAIAQPLQVAADHLAALNRLLHGHHGQHSVLRAGVDLDGLPIPRLDQHP
jgi:hypothetical protein